MSILTVGSVALDSVRTPFGTAEDAVGGSAVFFAASASQLTDDIHLVGVVGDDYPLESLEFLRDRGVSLAGLSRRPGESFRWSGVYDFDLNSRETLETRLGVFADFEPEIPEEARGAELVFLGNIDPQLQLEVLEQVDDPAFVACDTMNFWIDGARERLLDVLARVDAVFLNDSEARQLAGTANLLHAARWIRDRGPEFVVVKKGEHGAILFADHTIFFAPGYPLEEVFDPTGAGDAFAGGFFGYLAARGSVLDPASLRRAVIHGSAMGSFAVERFSVDRFRELKPEDVARRVGEFREMTAFEQEVEEGGESDV